MGSSTRNWISSVKLILISFGIVSLAMAIKFSSLFIVHFVFNQLPVIWSIILPWTKPPYLYIIMNCIIITIAAASRFHKTTSSPSIPPKRLVSIKTPPPLDFASFPVQPEISAVDEPSLLEYESENRIVEVKAVLVNGTKVDIDQTEEQIEIETDTDTEFAVEDKFVTSSYTCTPRHRINSPDLQSEFLPPVGEKPLVPSTYRHRTNSKGVKVRRATRPEKLDTLENSWKIITEASQAPPTKHHNKSDRWQHNGHHLTTSRPNRVPKSKTFKNHVNYESPFEAPLRLSTSAKISRESSSSQDELNCRVEAFIKKFNEEMRLQRQESLDQYMEMINRGV